MKRRPSSGRLSIECKSQAPPGSLDGELDTEASTIRLPAVLVAFNYVRWFFWRTAN